MPRAAHADFDPARPSSSLAILLFVVLATFGLALFPSAPTRAATDGAFGLGFINYVVRWNDGVSGLTRLGNGLPLAGRVGDSTSTNCNGSNPATIQVRINRPQIEAAGAGNYSDTLTVTITPQ